MSERQEKVETTASQSSVSKPALGYEYRVVWQREGLPKRRKLYQTLKGAEGCAGAQENDAPERTAAEVVARLREAAEASDG